jgi:hypothetical protein
MMDSRAFVATENGQAKTFTVTYTFPEGAVDAAKRCCELAGLVVIDPDDEATILRLSKVYHEHTQTRDPAVITGDAQAVSWDDDIEVIRQAYKSDIRVILAALRGGA